MMNIGELCNREVVIVRKDETLGEAAMRMRTHHVGDLVVVETRAGLRIPVGVLTDRDIVIGALTVDVERFASRRVGDLVVRKVVTGREDTSVLEALKCMRGHGVRRLPVVDDRQSLVGIVVFDDLIELVAEQMNDLVQLLRNEQRQERTLSLRPNS